MNTLMLRARSKAILCAVSATFLLTATVTQAQAPARRINSLDASPVVQLTGSRPGAVDKATDLGRAAADTALSDLTLSFSLAPEQRADLDQLLLTQQQVGSPNYHHWLTKGQFAARFGASAEDVAMVSQWLTSQHFTVVSATPLHIQFSGTTATAEAAFHTEMHRYTLPAAAGSTTGPRSFIANATPISLPAALAQAVSGISHLSTLRPQPMHRNMKLLKMSPDYTSSTGIHALVPSDIRTIYNVSSLYSAGYTGAGQKIAVVGQSTVDINDIAYFNTLFGGHNTNLVTTLVPGTGVATEVPEDEVESDLDLEYSGSMAKDATVLFFYAGLTGDAFDSIAYAVNELVAPTISISYGACELDFTASDAASLELLFDQGNAQGQTLVAASGDSGATGCDHGRTTANDGLALQVPADSPDVTAIGGLEFNEGAGTYWKTTNDAIYGSALSYIPEMVWNDSAITVPLLDGVSGGGGGSSILYSKPTWQVAKGVPADGARDVPDISLDASGEHDPYFLCGPPDTNGNSCANGYIYEAGGTSFGAPIFSGIVALIGQARGVAQGNINPQIYAISVSAPAAFHDTTVGDNKSPCTPGSTGCPAGTTSIGYSATAGYDLASGLGSIDAFAFAKAFPGFGSVTPLAATTAQLSMNPAAPTASSKLSFSVTITSTSTGTPAGNVQFAIDGVAQGTALPLASATATISSPAVPAGLHTVAVQYAGSSTFASVGGQLSFTVAALPVTSTVLSLNPVAPTASSSIIVTAKVSASSAGSPTGTVQYTLDGATVGAAQTLSSGSTSYTLGQLAAGQHTVQAVYSGDTYFATSLGVSTFTVGTVTPAQLSLAISPAAPSSLDNVTATATLNAAATGTVRFSVDGSSVGSAVSVTGGLGIGPLGKLTAGTHKITATYSGDATFGANTASITLSVTSSAATFSVSATDVSVTSGQTATSTVTLQSASTYAGTALLTLTGSGPSNLCYSIGPNPTVLAGATATSSIKFFTGATCTTALAHRLNAIPLVSQSTSQGKGLGLTFSLVSLLLVLPQRKRKHLRVICLALCVLCGLGLISGCGSTTPVQSSSNSGKFTLTLSGTDSTNAANTASATFILTEQ